MCGRQGLALRGNDDSGKIELDKEPDHNDGNFRALLRFRCSSGDEILRQHIATAPANARYISPSIQNELIAICGGFIRKIICDRVNESKWFSVLADETTDISGKEQLSVCLRYLMKVDTKYEVCESFLDFIKVDDLTGRGLASTIIAALKENGLDLTCMIGQGYDGAAAMSGHFNGVQAVVREEYPKCLYVHCSAHVLNLALCHSCQVQSIRNCIGVVTSIGTFIRGSAQRLEILINILKKKPSEKRCQTMISMCATRWVENHDGLLRFLDIMDEIAETLETLSSHKSIETSSKASALLTSMKQSDFIISLVSASELFILTLALCKQLQQINCDLVEAIINVDHVLDVVKEKRKNAEVSFNDIFTRSEEIAKTLEVEVNLPRLNKRQVHRSNIPHTSTEEYYRRSIFIPFLDDFISQLEERFINHRSTISGLQQLLPIYVNTIEFDDIKESVKFYLDEYEVRSCEGEFLIWQNKCKKLDVKPRNVLDTLLICSEDFFPNINSLLKILATLPISTATTERSFSTMRRLKTYLRCKTGQERLSGLALLNVHRDIILNPADVISKFMEKNRRMNLNAMI